jgi:hypothetical protein
MDIWHPSPASFAGLVIQGISSTCLVSQALGAKQKVSGNAAGQAKWHGFTSCTFERSLGQRISALTMRKVHFFCNPFTLLQLNTL